MASIASFSFAKPPWNPLDPPQGTFSDDWFAVTLAGSPCGHMHSTISREGDVIQTTNDMAMNMRRGPAMLAIKMEQTYRETTAGRPLAFEQVMTMSGQPVTVRGRIKDGKVRLVTEQFGNKQVRTAPFDAEVLLPWGQWLEQCRRGLAAGTRYVIKTYEPSVAADRALKTTVEIVGREMVEVAGKKMKGVRIRSTTDLGMAITSDAWVDLDGFPLLAEINLGVANVRVARTDKATALRGGRGPELFLSTFVEARGTINPAARRAALRLSVSEGAMPALPTTEMQRPRRIDGRTTELTLQRIDWGELRRSAAVAGPVPAEISREGLQASTYINSADPLIVKLCRQALRAAGNPRNPAVAADVLRKFVTEYVKNKDLDVAFATASEVAQSRQGDCTEHGVLLAALARAAGIPSRVAAGLIMIPEGRRSGARFGYHMWTQVYLGGRWVDIDAAMRETDCNPTHIALAIMTLNGEGLLEGSMSIWPLLGRLKIEAMR